MYEDAKASTDVLEGRRSNLQGVIYSHLLSLWATSEEMSIQRRRLSSPVAAPPLEDENLLPEILLRLPPDPSSLPRASAVCKHWHHVVSDPRFIRRFRRHHHSNPPLLGILKPYRGIISFQPTLEAPNRVSPGRFSLQKDPGDVLLPLGCRHGLVLILDPNRKQVLVWDPFTGDQDRIALPPLFDEEDALPSGDVIRAAGNVHFRVVLAMSASDDELHRRVRVLGCVYSSETGLWGNLISTRLPSTNLYPDEYAMSTLAAALIGDSFYWTLFGESLEILEFDFERQSLAVIRLPMNLHVEEDHVVTVMRVEGGGLGFLFVPEGELSAQLWKRKTDSDGGSSWELGRIIELDKLLSLNSVEERKTLTVVGFAECNNVVFLSTHIRLFMVHLESLQFKEVLQTNILACLPFESVYATGT